jgi:hypothetical protein
VGGSAAPTRKRQATDPIIPQSNRDPKGRNKETVRLRLNVSSQATVTTPEKDDDVYPYNVDL